MSSMTSVSKSSTSSSSRSRMNKPSSSAAGRNIGPPGLAPADEPLFSNICMQWAGLIMTTIVLIAAVGGVGFAIYIVYNRTEEASKRKGRDHPDNQVVDIYCFFRIKTEYPFHNLIKDDTRVGDQKTEKRLQTFRQMCKKVVIYGIDIDVVGSDVAVKTIPPNEESTYMNTFQVLTKFQIGRLLVMKLPDYKVPNRQQAALKLKEHVNIYEKTWNVERVLIEFGDEEKIDVENFKAFFREFSRIITTGLILPPTETAFVSMDLLFIIKQHLIVVDMHRYFVEETKQRGERLLPLSCAYSYKYGAIVKTVYDRALYVDNYFSMSPQKNLIYAISPVAALFTEIVPENKATGTPASVEFTKFLNMGEYCQKEASGNLLNFENSHFNSTTGCRIFKYIENRPGVEKIYVTLNDFTNNLVAAELKTAHGIGIMNIDDDDVDDQCFNTSYIFMRSVYHADYYDFKHRGLIT